MTFQRIIIIDLAAFGVGEASDANRYSSVGADTLGHLVERFGDRVQLPTLTALGLGNIRWDHQLSAIPMVEQPRGFYGKMHAAVRADQPASTLREMFDYSEPLRIVSSLNGLARQGVPIVLISRFVNYLANQDVCKQVQCIDDEAAFADLQHYLRKQPTGIVYQQVPELSVAAQQKDASKYLDRLMAADGSISHLLTTLQPTDLLVVTASFASDLTRTQSTTREYLPVILYTSQNETGHSVGIRRTLGDVATTLVDNFSNGEGLKHSLLTELGKSV